MYDYPIQPVPFPRVRVNDSFWLPRIETNRTVTVPFALEQCATTGRIDLFKRAAASMAGDPNIDRSPTEYPFDDSDVYKVIEAAAYTLAVHPDATLEAQIDAIAELIAAAQEPDGYIYPARTIDPTNPHKWSGSERWVLERMHSHELYGAGHLYEAAVAYAQATGKRTLLDVSLRSADQLVETFGPEKQSIWPGHQVTEIGLVKLHREMQSQGSRAKGQNDGATHDADAGPWPLALGPDSPYLDLARFLLEERGPDGHEGSGNTYNQSHEPVFEQSEAVGHAVRATYMYAGMADVAAILGDARYLPPLERIWRDVVGTKLHFHGGIGATHNGEAFGAAYELPNDTAYCETCAAIGLAFWAQRMFLLHGEAQYMDVLERALYNGLLSGVSLDGKGFFYDNPLESDGWLSRRPWFGCACCPGNFARFLPSLPGYIYAQRDQSIYVNLYIGSETEVTLPSGVTVALAQKTDYPWDGTVEITVSRTTPTNFAIRLRIPGWAQNQAVPSDLYRFIDADAPAPTLSVNGVSIDYTTDVGYAVIEREWAAGDIVTLDLPMPIRRAAAHKRVEADRNRVALQRGPVVYCLEWADNPGMPVRSILLEEETPLAARFDPNLLGRVVVIEGEGIVPDGSAGVKRPFTAIPYYAWANRGQGEMLVWLRSKSEGNH